MCTIKRCFAGCDVAYLEDQFDGKYAGEHVVEIVEDEVSKRALEHGIFGGQRHAAGADDDHNEQIEVAKIDDEMTEPTNTVHSQTTFHVRTELAFTEFTNAKH